MKKYAILLAAMWVFGIAGPAAAAFDYGNLHFVAIEDSDPATKHDAGDGTYEYHYDLGDFNVLPNGSGPGQAAGMFDWSGQVDTGITLGDFDATSWDNVFFGAYGLDALWYPPNDPARTEYPGVAGSGIAFTSAAPVTTDAMGGASGSALIGLIDFTKPVDAGQLEMTNGSSYLNGNSDPETGNYNNAINIDGAAWNAELQGLGDTFLYGFDKNDNDTLALLGSFTLSEDTDGSLLVDYTDGAPVPVPAAVWLFGSGLLGLIGIRRRNS